MTAHPGRWQRRREGALAVYGSAGSQQKLPIARTIEVLRRADERWLLVGTFTGRDVFRAAPFEAIEIELPLLWDEPGEA